MDATISAGFSGRPYDLRMRVFTIENNVGGNYSRYRGDRYAYSRVGYGAYTASCGTVNSWIGGHHAGGCYALMFDSNGGGGGNDDFPGKTIGVGVYDTGAIGHAADGSLNFTARIQMVNYSVFGTADTGDVWLAADHLPRPPQAPTPIGISNITTTSFQYQFSGNWDGGSPITSWQAQIATDAAFTQNVVTVNSSGTTTFSGLDPARTYYVRSRGNNAYWNGAWSTTMSATTLPATAPGIDVVPSLSGTAATVTLTPPNGSTAVTKYTVERRLVGTGTVVPAETTTTTLNVSNLTPGDSYEWRAKAWIGTYESPWSDWLLRTQPKPVTTPGDFFAGDTEDTEDISYNWTGLANLSTSQAMGQGVLGWEIDPTSQDGVVGAPLYTAWETQFQNIVLNPNFRDYGASVEVRRNVVPNPRGISGGTAWGSTTQGTLSYITDFPGTVNTAVRWTCTAIGAARVIVLNPGLALPALGSPIRVHLKLRITGGTLNSASVNVRPTSVSGGTGAVAIATLGTLGPGEHTIDVTGVTNGSTAATSAGCVVLVATPDTVGMTVDATMALVEASAIQEEYFDGSSGTVDSDFVTGWTGTINASASIVTGSSAANVPAILPTQGVSWITSHDPYEGSEALRYRIDGTVAIPIAVTGVLATTGQPYTLIFQARANSRNQAVTPRVRGATAPSLVLQQGVWTEIRVTVNAGSGVDTQTGLLINAGSGHQRGDTIDIDRVALVPGAYSGQFFDGDTTDPNFLARYLWDGVEDESASRFETRERIAGWGAGGEVVMHRATGGVYGSHSARLVVRSDCGVPEAPAGTVGIRAGQEAAAGFWSDVEAGANYTGLVSITPPRSQRVAAEFTWLDAVGGIVGRTLGDQVVAPSGSPTTLIVNTNAPAGAEHAVVRAVDVAGPGWSPWLSGEIFLLDGGMVTLAGPFGYFDGSFPPVGNYVFSWESTPHNSISLRTTVDLPSLELIDPDCVQVPAPPRPPVVPNTCIDEVGMWRRVWKQVNATDVREWFDTIPTVTIRTGSQAERQVRIRYYANPFNRPLSALSQDDYCGEIIVSYLPPDSVLTLDGITEMSWASVSGGPSMPADHLLYGSNGMPAEWPVLECGIGYYITMDVPTDNPVGNVSFEFDLVTRY